MSSPPWALISSKISSVAFLCGMPQGAAGPERGVETPNLMTSCPRAFTGANATSPATVRNAAQITERCELSATPPRLGVRSEGLAHADYRNVDRSLSMGDSCQGVAVDGSVDYTHAHVHTREGDPVPEIPEGDGRRARPGRGAPMRSGRGAGSQR